MVLVVACAGGQTGEITRPTACRELVREVAVSDATGEALRDRDAIAGSRPSEMDWEHAAPSPLNVEVVTTEVGMASEIGGTGCNRSFWQFPVTVRLNTADQQLQEEFSAVMSVHGEASALVEASLPFDQLNGRLRQELPHLQGARLTLSISLADDLWGGQLFAKPMAEDGVEQDEILLGSWQ